MTLKTRTIDLRLYAALMQFAPPNADRFPIEAGVTIGRVLESLSIPMAEAKLVFINGVRTQLSTRLQGGERVGVFPPVGGG